MTSTGPAARRGRPRAGVSRLSRQRVVDVAVRLVEDVGPEGLSMRKVAAELGVDSMSLYNYVANKDALLDGIAEGLIASIVIPEPVGDWRTDLTALARAFRDAALRRPKSVSLLLTRELSSIDENLAPAEVALAILTEAGFSHQHAVHAFRAFFAFLVGTILREISVGPTFSGQNLGDIAHRRAELAERGLPVVAAAAPHLAVIDNAEEFDFGMTLLIIGLEDQLARQRT